jgi:multidrug efflux pump subunit AcrA (membrane-fusion protein)
MKKAVVIVVLVVVIACAAVAIFSSLISGSSQPVRVARVRLADLDASVNTNGLIEPVRIFELRAPASGICRRILAREGDTLKRGSLILEIEGESLYADLATARAELAAAEVEIRDTRRGPTPEELDVAEAELARSSLAVEHARQILQTNEWLLERNAISKHEVELARQELSRAELSRQSATTRRDDLKKRYDDSDRKRAEARSAAARTRIAYLEEAIAKLSLRAPEDGTLYQFAIKDGAWVNSGDLVGLFTNLHNLRLKAFVDEPELGKIAPGLEVVISWSAHPEKTWKATVEKIPSQVVALGARSVAEVLCRIQDPSRELIPNLHVDVQILTAHAQQVATLPRDVVFSEGRYQFVWAARDGRARKIVVETGRSSSSRIEISRGLALGDAVIIPDTDPIAEGMKIRIVQ